MDPLLLYLGLAVLFTLTVSGLCSLLEAMILSTTTAEIEGLKQRSPKAGKRLEHFRTDIEETSSAILGLNTIANTAGASVSGALATTALGEENFALFSAGLVIAILIFSEVIPKNVGVLYRPAIQPLLVHPLHWIRTLMTPMSYLCKASVWLVVRKRPQSQEDPDEEILLLTEKSAKEGDLSESERRMITNALRLDSIPVRSIMTPRTVMTALEAESPVEEVVRKFPNIPFARLPVYRENIDEIVGVVRRRDLLARLAEQQGETRVGELMTDTVFIPETAHAADALQSFLQNHQQLGIVVDEYGSVTGVLTMEDVMESILGQEIFEHDDVAVDMRELARHQSESRRRPGEPTSRPRPAEGIPRLHP